MLYTGKYYFLLHTYHLLDKISLEIELSGPSPSEKDGPAPVPILYISISRKDPLMAAPEVYL